MVAYVEYWRPSGRDGFGPGRTEMERDRWPGGQLGLRDDWLVVTVGLSDIAFYPRPSIVRAWSEPESS